MKKFDISRAKFKSSISLNEEREGEPLEIKVTRMLNNGENLTETSIEIFTPYEVGVLAGHDIRTDKWEHAIDAMDKVSKTRLAKGEGIPKVIDLNKDEKEQATE